MAILILISGIIDYRYRKIPDTINILIFVWALFFSSATIYERVAGFIVTAAPLFVLALATGKLKGGDYKFLVMCASALGMSVFVKILALAVLIAVPWSIAERKDSVPLAFVFMLGYAIFIILFEGGYL